MQFIIDCRYNLLPIAVTESWQECPSCILEGIISYCMRLPPPIIKVTEIGINHQRNQPVRYIILAIRLVLALALHMTQFFFIVIVIVVKCDLIIDFFNNCYYYPHITTTAIIID